MFRSQWQQDHIWYQFHNRKNKTVMCCHAIVIRISCSLRLSDWHTNVFIDSQRHRDSFPLSANWKNMFYCTIQIIMDLDPYWSCIVVLSKNVISNSELGRVKLLRYFCNLFRHIFNAQNDSNLSLKQKWRKAIFEPLTLSRHYTKIIDYFELKLLSQVENYMKCIHT